MATPIRASQIRHVTAEAVYFKALDDEKGVIEAIVSVYNLRDRGKDIILLGCFAKSIARKLPKVCWVHDWRTPIGKTVEARELAPGDPLLPESIREFGGLYVKGQLNLETQRGKEGYSDLKFGSIDEFSIGYIPVDEEWDKGKNANLLKEAELLEWSPVIAGMNPATELIDIKDVSRGTSNLDDKQASGKTTLGLAPRSRTWNAGAADKRVRKWAGVDEEPNAKYAQAHFWKDEKKPKDFGSYKLPFADVIDGELKAVPRAIFAAAAACQGARGGVSMPSKDMPAVKKRIERYYARMRKEFDDETIIAPWKREASATALGKTAATGLSVLTVEERAAYLQSSFKGLFRQVLDERGYSFYELCDVLWCAIHRLYQLCMAADGTDLEIDPVAEIEIIFAEFLYEMWRYIAHVFGEFMVGDMADEGEGEDEAYVEESGFAPVEIMAADFFKVRTIPLTGMTVEQHSAAVLSAVGEFAKRIDRIRQKRLEKSPDATPVSEANQATIAGLVKDLSALVVKPKAEPAPEPVNDSSPVILDDAMRAKAEAALVLFEKSA